MLRGSRRSTSWMSIRISLRLTQRIILNNGSCRKIDGRQTSNLLFFVQKIEHVLRVCINTSDFIISILILEAREVARIEAGAITDNEGYLEIFRCRAGIDESES